MTVQAVLDRRIAAAILHARREAGHTGDWAASKLGWSVSKLSRIENAVIPVRVSDLTRLLALYEIPDDQRAAIIGLARQILDEGGGRSRRTPDRPSPETYTAAHTIREWSPVTVPRFLRTPAYATAVLESQTRIFPRPPGVTREMVKEITAPQSRLTRRGGLTLRALAGAPALRRPFGGPAVMRQQIEHILTAGDGAVAVRVLPLDDGGIPGDVPAFIHAQFVSLPAALVPDVVLLPQLGRVPVTIDEEDAAYRHLLAFEEMWPAAASETESRELLTAALKSWGG